MIKRYGLGAKAEKVTDESVQFGLMGIVERPDGEYYKASDVDAVLESIGAGGVSGRITSKSIDEHRAEFEVWADANGLNLQLSPYGGYEKGYTLDAWATWKAARGLNP